MGRDTKIQWCHHTFNCWRGCSRVSEGCRFCYAEVMSRRNQAVFGTWGPQGTRVVLAESGWREPLAWDRAAAKAGERHRVFCASLADVFEDWDGPMLDASGNVLHYNSAATWWISERTPHGPIPMRFVRERLFSLIHSTTNLDWLLLTKRPENAKIWAEANPFPSNVWLGTSVEDQETADSRIPVLLRTQVPVRFLSMEPLLGPVDLGRWMSGLDVSYDSEGNDLGPASGGSDLDWVILGGESGRQARPFHLNRVRDIIHQCRAAAVPVFMKQLGTCPRWDRDEAERYLSDRHGGNIAEFPEDLRTREVPFQRVYGDLEETSNGRNLAEQS
jgi:protein gp37